MASSKGISLWTRAARWVYKTRVVQHYKAKSDKQLREHGLLWEDLMVVTPQVERALARLTAEEQQARTRRISRAVDMDIKHVYLAKDQQTLDPDASYLRRHLEDVQRLDQEREDMGMA